MTAASVLVKPDDVERRRQPVDGEIDVQQAHEERRPTAARVATPRCSAKRSATLAWPPSVSPETMRTSSPRERRESISRAGGGLPPVDPEQRRKAHRLGQTKRERGRQPEREDAPDDEHGAPTERRDELRGCDAAPIAPSEMPLPTNMTTVRGVASARIPTRARSRSAARCRDRPRSAGARRADPSASRPGPSAACSEPNAMHDQMITPPPANAIRERRQKNRAQQDAEQARR